jgi:ATP-dependent 26S proteasome regulatory subunit
MKKAAVIPVISAPIPWEQRNQRDLVREFAALRKRLGEVAEADSVREPEEEKPIDPPAAIDALTAIFDLSVFERELLLLLAGVEMDSGLALLCSEVAGRAQCKAVTFSLAMATLRDPHWSALAPSAPLRRYRLIEMEPGHGLTSAPLHIDERVLHYLAGVNRIDERLDAMLMRKPKPSYMAEEHVQLAAGLTAQIAQLPTIAGLHLCGDDSAAQENVAALIAHDLGRELLVLRMEDTPAAGAELEQFLHLWMREGLLLPAFLLLQWEGNSPGAAALQLAERLSGLLILASRDSLRLHRPLERCEVNKPGPRGQKRLWIEALGRASEEHKVIVEEIAEQFRFSAETIASIGHTVEGESSEAGRARIAARLWGICRSHARPELESMAERIEPSAAWSDLVLPEAQLHTLRQLVAQSRHRLLVYETWGFAAKGRRGLGVSALFSGPSGTGKTLAAEVLAHELKLDLYRIDLSAVVSKYIGETEKNLKQVFDAAECGGVLLLFDEADALFGKRAEVKDSHDRYANIEVGYLLQRMESFRGLAILTTNLKSSLDKAFQRRLRFSVDFPFPDATQRQAIWSRAFPKATPTRDLEPARLAHLNMTGGNIRNIALNAAFLAAESNESVTMSHLLEAAQLEATKAERPIAEMETRGWV